MPGSHSVTTTRIGAALIGVVAAVATVFVTEGLRKPPNVSAATPASSGDVTGEDTRPLSRTIVVDRTHATEIAELRRQVQELKDAQAASATKATAAEEPLSPAETHRALEAHFAELERQHAADPVDSNWSPAAEKSLVGALKAFGGELGFTLGPTQCRTTTCRATVSWSDYEAARKVGRELAERTLPGLPCGQQIWLKEPDDPKAPYSTQLYVDCAAERAGDLGTVSSKQANGT
jgi:hypothetical protein